MLAHFLILLNKCSLFGQKVRSLCPQEGTVGDVGHVLPHQGQHVNQRLTPEKKILKEIR